MASTWTSGYTAAACEQELPIYEPGLFEVVKEARGRNLFFSTDTQKHVAEGDIIFVRYPQLRHAGGDAT